jgi:predicted DNA-binding protein with PD1-like motif
MKAASDVAQVGLPWPVRLLPGDELRAALQAVVAARGLSAAFVLAGIGSLRPARVRLAGADTPLQLEGDLELLSLSGTIAANGVHLHLSVADAEGRVIGGHAAAGCIVRTTAEVLLAPLPGWDFAREPDARTGWSELVIRRRHPG